MTRGEGGRRFFQAESQGVCRRRRWIIFLGLSSFLLMVMGVIMMGEAAGKFSYPPARRAEVVEEYFGVTVRDPYRWVEEADSPETQAFVEAQNRLFYEFVESYEDREAVRARLTELWNYPKYSLPRREGERYYFWKNDGLQNQPVLYQQKSLEGPAEVVLDPNEWSPDGTAAVTSEFYSRDGRFLVYGISRSGSDWQELKIRDVDTGRDFEETLHFCRFASAAWQHNNEGFFYDRFPRPGEVPQEDRNNYNRVYWHKLGTPQSSDTLVYERPDQKEWGFTPFITDDGSYLVLHISHGTDPRSRIYYREAESSGPFIKLLDDFDAAYEFIDNIGPVFYFKTDLQAPRGRIIAIALRSPGREHWHEILPEQKEVLEAAVMVNDHFVVSFLQDAASRLKIYNREGRLVREIKLPVLGSVTAFSGRRTDTDFFFRFESFLYPPTVFRYDFKTSQLTVFRRSEIKFDPGSYETRQVFFRSKDSTRVPMFIMHKKGLKRDGRNPTLLYGYGGFNISLTPTFSPARLVWLENGGVFAVPNLRGGGEYGKEWHQAGMGENKQNVFDDFLAAAEWLIAKKYTSPARLAIQGGSNGGLLVAACEVQRPELFGAVVSEVPVIDMLRFHKFTIGHYWIPEYGCAERSAEEFRILYAYSPLHNIRPGIAYPPTLVTTADTDDRVAPFHAKKFIAALQAADAGSNPLLLRVETKAGHGVGKPTSKVIEEVTDVYCFLFKVFGIRVNRAGAAEEGRK